MALSILDGNQSATTLSTILSSGQHITAHTVVSLGTQAITDMRGAVSGSVVSISNFPTSQVISGTVTANPTGTQTIAGTVTVGNTVTVSGTVNAGLASENDFVVIGEEIAQGINNQGTIPISGTVTIGSALPAGTNRIGVVTIGGGTVTIGAGTAQIGSVTVGNSVTIASLPALVAGTAQIGSVTASISNSVTIASFATSVTARLINPAGTAVTYAEVGTAGNPSIDVLSVQGVTSGTPLAILNHQGTTVTTSNFTSTTASTVLASANTGREVLTIFNEGAGNLHICAGATCTTIAYQVRLSAGDYYEVPLNQTSLTHSAVFATAGTARVVQIS